MTRPARVSIDLAALRHNLVRVREYAPHSKVMAIVKADAYGHGISRVAPALAQADAFGVACLEEARQLRQAGVEQKILLLEGPYGATELAEIQQRRLDIVIHHRVQLELLEQAEINVPLKVWLKVDSGMHRLGFAPEDIAPVCARLLRINGVAQNVRFISHLACANEPDSPLTQKQGEVFFEATQPYRAEKSLANSAALLSRPDYCLDWVRPGLMLYGVSPLDARIGTGFNLKPVMTFGSSLISVKRLRGGDPVGYGASWRCPQDMPVGVVAAGYGDGYPRHAVTGTRIQVRGKDCALIGKPSMDMMTLDLRACPDAAPGDPVLLWGDGLPVEETAIGAATVPYEVLCGVHKRLEFVAYDQDQSEETIPVQ
ncbi:MAG: alanine racemase [Gammaproteobacteria bacterium]|nr:alanine racemase [Gammaproteobacteria bacterium]MCY4338756.1 alanine racemase [Gammaproteobacteria bacterium]